MVVACYELTSNIGIIMDLVPKNIKDLPAHSRAALVEFYRCRGGLMRDCEATAYGYVLFAKWMEALYEYAKYTGQLLEFNANK